MAKARGAYSEAMEYLSECSGREAGSQPSSTPVYLTDTLGVEGAMVDTWTSSAGSMSDSWSGAGAAPNPWNPPGPPKTTAGFDNPSGPPRRP